jgi:hypothetical protein
MIPSGSWYSNMRKRTTTGSGYLNRLGTEQPLVRVLKTLRSKGLAVLGVSKTSWVRVFEHVQNRRTVGSGVLKTSDPKNCRYWVSQRPAGFHERTEKDPAVLADI